MDRSQAPEALPPEVASRQVVTGDIPLEPPGFQPRADLLAELDRVRVRVPVVHVVTGQPGVGKTLLAAAYARAKLAAGWRLVAWVNAEDAGSLLTGLARAADAAGLGHNDARPDARDLGRLVRRQLEADGDRCLLVFDDVRDPELLRPFVPSYGAARVLITGPGRSSAIEGTTVAVDVFTGDEALAFLTRRTGRMDEEGAAALAAELGHLPLALAQAAAVIADRSIGYRAYLEQLRKVQVGESLIREAEQRYGSGAARAVLLSLRDMRAEDTTGTCTPVTEILAVLSPAGVRRDLLHAAGQGGALAAGGYRVAAALVDEALARLAERALVTVSLDGQTIIMHRMVMVVASAEMARRQRVTAVCRAAASVLAAWAQTLAQAVSRDRLAVRDIPEQVSALLASSAGPVAEGDEELVKILLRLRFLALYYLVEPGGSASQAVAVGEPLIADLERVLGPDDPATLNARNSLAGAYQAAGRAEEAIRLFERTLVSRQRLLGPDHPDTMTSQNNLAAAYRDAGRPAEAVLLFELTLANRERLLGADHPSTLNSRGNLAAAYLHVGRNAEAIPLFEQTLAARERILGPDHPDTQRSRNNLAAARRGPGRLARERAPAEEADSAGQIASPGQIAPPEEAASAEEIPPTEEFAPAEEIPPTEQAPAHEQEPRPAEGKNPPRDQDQDPPSDSGPPSSAAPAAQGPDDQVSSEAAPDHPPEAARDPEQETSGPEPSATPDRRPVRRLFRLRRVLFVGLSVVVLILLVAGGVVLAGSRPHTGGRPSGQAAAPASGPVQMAAGWISRQVSRSVIVACDPTMCAALEARGMTAANLLVLRSAAASPLGAQVVVATQAVRSQFGGRLDSVYAPSIMASFGSGSGQVSVQVVAPQGAAAYLTALSQDVAARKIAGAQLLANKRIAVAVGARALLASGEVDSRLLILLPALAAEHPIQVLAFGDPGPGASPGIPWCSADLSGSGQAAGMTDGDYVSWLTAFVQAQLLPFAGTIATPSPEGQLIVRIEYSRPSPLGLLAR